MALLSLFLLVVSAFAQGSSSPLVIVNRSLYWLDGNTLTPTAPGNPVIYATLSPDTQTIALMRMAQVVLVDGWGVTYDSVTGWTAEGVDDYFLEPAGAG